METITEEHSTDLNQLFSTLKVWTFSFENHHTGMYPQRVCDLCTKVEGILIANCLGSASTFDTQNLQTATEFLMRNTIRFTIAEFMNCFDISCKAYNEFSAAVFGQTALNVSISQNEIAELKALVAKLKHDQQVLQTKHDTKLASEVATSMKNLVPQYTSSPNSASSTTTTINSTPFLFSNPATISSSSSLPGTGAPNAKPQELSLQSLSEAIYTYMIT